MCALHTEPTNAVLLFTSFFYSVCIHFTPYRQNVGLVLFSQYHIRHWGTGGSLQCFTFSFHWYNVLTMFPELQQTNMFNYFMLNITDLKKIKVMRNITVDSHYKCAYTHRRMKSMHFYTNRIFLHECLNVLNACNVIVSFIVTMQHISCEMSIHLAWFVRMLLKDTYSVALSLHIIIYYFSYIFFCCAPFLYRLLDFYINSKHDMVYNSTDRVLLYAFIVESSRKACFSIKRRKTCYKRQEFLYGN